MTGISQESNSFNPLMSGYDDFYVQKGQVFRENLGIQALLKRGFHVTESIFARAVPGGVLRFHDFMRLVSEMLEPLERYMFMQNPEKIDSITHSTFHEKPWLEGVLLLMHGALEVEHIGSGETYVLGRVREIVGPDTPISAALDMHANITYTFAKNCNIITGFRTAPHTDVPKTHEKAALLLARAISNGELPRTELIRIPLMMPGENMMTESGLGREVISRLPEIDGMPGVYSSSYFVGMAWVDCPQNGAAVVLSGVGDLSEGLEKAGKLADFVWENRDNFTYQGLALAPEESVEFAMNHMKSGKLVVLSDSADNVTAGAAGDNAFMLNLFLHRGIVDALFAAIIDPDAVAKCKEHKIGDVLDIKIGACFDSSSETCTMKGAVLKFKTAGAEPGKYDSCVLAYRGIDVLVFSKRKPVFNRETLEAHGINLNGYSILVVKQGYLSPELAAITSHSCLVLTSGNCDQNITRINYKKIRRPMYPMDDLCTTKGTVTPPANTLWTLKTFTPRAAQKWRFLSV